MKIHRLLSLVLLSTLGVVACGTSGGEDDFTITLNEHSLSLTVGDTYQLEATTSVDTDITWSSSNTSYVTVEDGFVTAISAGSATITAAAKGKSDSCVITVTEKVKETSTLTMIRSYPLNNVTFIDLEEGQEFEVGEEIDIVFSVSFPFESRPAERYRLYAGNTQLQTSIVEGEQKLQASYTVTEDDFAIYTYYSDYLPDPTDGVNVTIDNEDDDFELLGFDKSAKWGRPNGFIITKPNYQISKMEWRYVDEESWTTASTNTFQPSYCGNAARSNPDYAQYFIFRVQTDDRQPLSKDIHIKFTVEEIIEKSISYVGSDNPLIDQISSTFPTTGVVGATINLVVKPEDGSTKVSVTSSETTISEYSSGQYQFVMPNKDVVITITCVEANIEINWVRPTGVSSKIVGEDDPATQAFNKVNAGESYYLYASVNIANHYVKQAVVGDVTYDLVKTGDQDEQELDYYKARITIPNDATGSITITLIEEQQPLSISFERPNQYRNKMVILYDGILQEGTVVTVASDSVFAKPLAMTILVNGAASTIEVTESNEFDEEEQKYAYEGSFVMPNSDVKLRFTEVEVPPEEDELTITISGVVYSGNKGMQYSYEGKLVEGTLVTVTNKATSTFANPQTMTVTVNGHEDIIVAVNEVSEKMEGAQYYSYYGTFIMPAYSVTLSFSRVTA